MQVKEWQVLLLLRWDWKVQSPRINVPQSSSRFCEASCNGASNSGPCVATSAAGVLWWCQTLYLRRLTAALMPSSCPPVPTRTILFISCSEGQGAVPSSFALLHELD